MRLNKFGIGERAASEDAVWTDLPVEVAKRQIARRTARFLGNLQAEEENGDY